MASPLALHDAIQLAKRNRDKYERLEAKRSSAEIRSKRAEKTLGDAYSAAFDTMLAPFAVAFSQLKNVELADLPILDAVPELKLMPVKLQTAGIKAVEGLTTLAGSTAAGAAAGGLTFTAVGTFAAASTGTAIASLSGAAATSATLAWLGGGSLAAGGMGVAGGTAVLAGVVAVPALAVLGGFLWWKGVKELKEQQKVEQQLNQAEQDLRVQLTQADNAVDRALKNAKVVRQLSLLGAQRLAWFERFVVDHTDYAMYRPVEKSVVAELSGIATALSAVIAAPLLDDQGFVTYESVEVFRAGESLAKRLS